MSRIEMKLAAWPILLLACRGAVATPVPNDAAPPRDAAVPRADAAPPLRSAIFCGATPCSTIDSEGEPQVCCIERRDGGPDDRTCRSGTADCAGHRIGCDDSTDCAASGLVCCAEVGEGEPATLLTACRPSCVTGVPRARVCATTAECADCAPFTCRGLPTSKYCGRPEFCP